MYIFLELIFTGEILWPEQANGLQLFEVCQLLASIGNHAGILRVLRILLAGRNSNTAQNSLGTV